MEPFAIIYDQASRGILDDENGPAVRPTWVGADSDDAGAVYDDGTRGEYGTFQDDAGIHGSDGDAAPRPARSRQLESVRERDRNEAPVDRDPVGFMVGI